MNLNLKGKIAIVTGGARGIGKGCCIALAQEGCDLIMADFDCEREIYASMDKLAEENHVRITCIQGDVSNEETVANIFRQAERTFGRVDILVNNAGRGSIRKPFHLLTTEDWRAVQDVTLNSMYFMCREFVRLCREKNQPGSVVNVLSKSAFTTNSVDNTTYVCAKAGAWGLTKGIANEMANYNIRVNGVVPGYVQTERTYLDGEERTERMRKLLPTGQFTQPIEIGRVVAFLASDKASSIIGAAVDCSGGTML